LPTDAPQHHLAKREVKNLVSGIRRVVVVIVLIVVVVVVVVVVVMVVDEYGGYQKGRGGGWGVVSPWRSPFVPSFL
jgi:hypothetical protein